MPSRRTGSQELARLTSPAPRMEEPSQGLTYTAHMATCSLDTGHTGARSTHPGTGNGCICRTRGHCRALLWEPHSYPCSHCTHTLCPCGWRDSDTLHTGSGQSLGKNRAEGGHRAHTRLARRTAAVSLNGVPKPPGPSCLPSRVGTSTEDALMALTAGVVTLAQTPRALAAAAATPTLASALPAAQGPRPIRGPAAGLQVWGGQLRLRALTQLTKAARGTAGRGTGERERGVRVEPSLNSLKGFQVLNLWCNPFGSRMALLRRFPKTMGKHRCLYRDS